MSYKTDADCMHTDYKPYTPNVGSLGEIHKDPRLFPRPFKVACRRRIWLQRVGSGCFLDGQVGLCKPVLTAHVLSHDASGLNHMYTQVHIGLRW